MDWLEPWFESSPTLPEPERFKAPDREISASLQQGAKGEAVAIYSDPSATKALECSSVPAGVNQ